MKNNLFLLVFSLLTCLLAAQDAKVEGILTIEEGIIFPLYTTADRDTIPATVGYTIFNIESSSIEYYDGTCWRQVQSKFAKECDCADGQDNDGDGFTDAEDTDCQSDPNCMNGVDVQGKECACNDGIDNDSDGFTDCEDANCQTIFECDCTDGLDDDGDGFIDCQDFDCQSIIECDCDDGIDNDGDGFTDAQDSDCCMNGLDNQGQECDCTDGIDNDGDGFTDCQDFDCSTIIECNCTDGIDNDNDGFVDANDTDCQATLNQNTTTLHLIEELQQANQQLQHKNEELERRLEVIEKLLQLESATILLEGKAYLKQNAPNPFHQNTTIDYYLPSNMGKASIQIIDLNGSVLKTIPIQKVGKGSIHLMANELPNGIYQYSLMVEGKMMDSKRMVLVE